MNHPIFILPALVAALSLTACKRDPAVQDVAPPTEHDLPVLVLKVESLPIHYQTVGSVVSDERVEIGSRIAAYLRSLEVREGERVHRGQRLATLDGKDVDSTIRQAGAQRERAAATLRDAEKTLVDTQTLFAGGMVSAVAQRKAQLERDVAARDLEGADAALSAARAQTQYAQIVSPVDGVVVSRIARSGDLVTPGATIMVVESDTALLFETFVAESQVGKIAQGDSVAVSIDATGKAYAGSVVRLVPSGDPVTRRYQAKIQLIEAGPLSPGMFGRCTFSLGARPGLTVPKVALIERGGLTGVFVASPDGLLRFRLVRTGRQLGARVEVSTGLRAGETVLAQTDETVREGDRLRRPVGKR